MYQLGSMEDQGKMMPRKKRWQRTERQNTNFLSHTEI